MQEQGTWSTTEIRCSKDKNFKNSFVIRKGITTKLESRFAISAFICIQHSYLIQVSAFSQNSWENDSFGQIPPSRFGTVV